MPSVAARGTGMRAIAETVEQIDAASRHRHALVSVGSGYPIIYGECGSGPKTFVVYGHYDVQPVGHLTEWTAGPFAATIVRRKTVRTRRGEQQRRSGCASGRGRSVSKDVWQTAGDACVSLSKVKTDSGSPSLYRFASEHAEMLEGRRLLVGRRFERHERDVRSSVSVSRASRFWSCARLARALICTRSGARSFPILPGVWCRHSRPSLHQKA